LITVAFGIVLVIVVVGFVVVVVVCNHSQMRTSKCTCLIFGLSVGLDPGYKRTKGIFTRDSIYAIARICHGNSVCPSVTRVDQSKAFEVRIVQFSPYSSPISLVSAG